jgi:hypothetical protein
MVAGETLHLAVTVSGMGEKKDGQVDCIADGGVFDANGRCAAPLPDNHFRDAPSLGGATGTWSYCWSTERAIPPGNYEVRVNVRDKVRREKQTQSLPVRVSAPDQFAAINIGIFHGSSNETPATSHVPVGDQVCLKFSVVGFAMRDMMARTLVRLTILDQEGKAVTRQPQVIDLSGEKERLNPALTFLGLPGEFSIRITRPGRFTLHLEIRDQVASKKTSYDIPIVASKCE